MMYIPPVPLYRGDSSPSPIPHLEAPSLLYHYRRDVTRSRDTGAVDSRYRQILQYCDFNTVTVAVALLKTVPFSQYAYLTLPYATTTYHLQGCASLLGSAAEERIFSLQGQTPFFNLRRVRLSSWGLLYV